MGKEYDVLIYSRHISLDIVIPEEHVWDFMAQFGRKFAIGNSEGTTHITPVDSYYDHPGGWHVKVTVWEIDEAKFYSFLRRFCEEKSVTFEDPERT